MGNKAYVIFTGTITRMGGAQMYVANKVKYMRELGWTVYVFSGLKGPIIIGSLSEYENDIFEELNDYPAFQSKRRINKIVSVIENRIEADNYSEIVIESNTAHISCWAEIIAQSLDVKHYMFLLDEYFNIDSGLMPFFEFKFDRHEIAFINEKSISLLFPQKAQDINPSAYILSAACNNVVEDVLDERFDAIDYSDIDYTICSLGRLNKLYIPNVIKGFEKFAESNPEKKIAYIFIGDQPKDFVPNMTEQVKIQLGRFKNVKLYMMGYVYPVPKSLFSHLDLVVASAGSARVSWAYDVPTISMDATDGEPIGVLGYDTENTLYRGKNENVIDLSIYLDNVLKCDYLKGKKYTPYVIEDNNVYLKEHLIYANTSVAEKSFYPVTSCKVTLKKNRAKSLLIRVLGIKGYSALKAIKGKSK